MTARSWTVRFISLRHHRPNHSTVRDLMYAHVPLFSCHHTVVAFLWIFMKFAMNARPQSITYSSRGEKTLHQPPKNVFFSPTYLESWKCLENSFCCSHCEIWAERVHLRPSLSAILDFPQSQGGVRKTLHMNTYVMSIVFIEVPHESRHIVHYFNV